jgi:hypothetical protein
LKFDQGIGGRWEDLLKMFHCLQQRFAMATGRRWRSASMKFGSQNAQAMAQTLQEMVERVQGQRPLTGFGGGLDGERYAPPQEERPEDGCRDGVTRQELGEKHRETASATTPFAAFGTTDALPAFDLFLNALNLVAVEVTMTIQCLDATTERAPHLFEPPEKIAPVPEHRAQSRKDVFS